MTERVYDIAVIGGGPAGTAAAITAARGGARVLLLEKGDFPRQRVCGEFVSPESLELLQHLLSAQAPGATDSLLNNAVRIRSARTFIDGQVIETEISPAAFSIPRYEMDVALWKTAQSLGVDARPRVTVQQIIRNGDFILEVKAEEATAEESFPARAVINATGRWSNFKAAVIKVPPGPKWIGVKAHFTETAAADSSSTESLDLHFFDGGYCGVSSIGHNQINACAMVRADVAKTLVEVFNCEPRLASRSRRWKAVTDEVSTAPLVFHTPTPVAAHVLLAGDAAGFIDPFVGDGISMALHSGSMAATAVVENNFRVNPAAEQYQAAYARRLAPAFNNAARIRTLMSFPRLVRWPVLQMIKVPGMSEFLLRRTRAGVAA